MTGIFFSLQCLTEKNIISPSALLIFQPFLFLCFPSPGWALKLWILLYFFSLCASWIIRSWFTTYLLQSDWEVFLQFTWFIFFTVDLLWPSQSVWIQTSNCFLMLMHSLELTAEDCGVSGFTVTFHITLWKSKTVLKQLMPLAMTLPGILSFRNGSPCWLHCIHLLPHLSLFCHKEQNNPGRRRSIVNTNCLDGYFPLQIWTMAC